MEKKNPTLKEQLISDLPHEFVSGLINGMESLYADSHAAMFNDPELGDVQANAVLGHYRRGRAETLLERIAMKCGTKTNKVQPEGGGCPHVSVDLDRFELVICHVNSTSSDSFPRHSFDRAQSSQVNKYLPQADLFEEPEAPDEKKFFAIVVHSEAPGKKDVFGSIKIGFPNHEGNGWIEAPVCLMEILDIQQRKFIKEEDLQGQIQNDKAKPRLKKPWDVDKAADDEAE